jgi:hypothetical protein
VPRGPRADVSSRKPDTAWARTVRIVAPQERSRSDPAPAISHRSRRFGPLARDRRRRGPQAGRARCQGIAANPDRAPRAGAVGDRRREVSPHRCPGPARRVRQRTVVAGPWRARALARPTRRPRAGSARASGQAPGARAPRPRAASADETRTGPLQVREAPPEGPGRRWVRGLGGASAARPDRHARRLVAAQALVRLSVTQGVALHARPRFADASIAASVRR